MKKGDNSECYIYQAEIYCKTCGELIREQLDKEGKTPLNLDDENSYDSDKYPKGSYEVGEADYPQHCSNCLVFMENSLTENGVKAVKDCLINSPKSHLVKMWAKFYHIKVEK
jgi:transcription initiation factor TFIIIB Brf1 subunit/transcription initiation factor TFIIB